MKKIYYFSDYFWVSFSFLFRKREREKTPTKVANKTQNACQEGGDTRASGGFVTFLKTKNPSIVDRTNEGGTRNAASRNRKSRRKKPRNSSGDAKVKKNSFLFVYLSKEKKIFLNFFLKENFYFSNKIFYLRKAKKFFLNVCF